MLLMMSLAGVALLGCADEENGPQTQYGYVQFKVGQAVTRSLDRLESLAEAKKVKVLLQYDGHIIEQTLLLNAFNEESAEYGLRSDKLRLLAGEYSLIGYVLYNQLDQEIQHRDIEDCLFEIVPGGLHVQHISPDVVERGRVSFKLVKEWKLTRGVGGDGNYPFTDIRTVDITVQHLFTKELTTFDKIPVKYTEDFTPSSVETSYAVCDTLLWLKAGEYRVHHCIT